MGRSPIRPPDPRKPKKRRCLKCRKKFKSRNWICAKCSEENEKLFDYKVYKDPRI